MKVRAVVCLPALVWSVSAWAQVPAGGHFTVSAGNTTGPVVAMQASGGFVVVWSDYNDIASHSDVWARRYDAAGASLGAAFRVNSYTTGCQGGPRGVDVDGDPAGDFVVVWHTFGCFGAPGPEQFVAQRFTRSGTRAGAEFRVDGPANEPYGAWPRVASSGTGSAIVVWLDSGPTPSSPNGIVGQRYGASGEPLGAQLTIDADATSVRGQPNVAAGPAGDFVVTWQRFDPGPQEIHVFARLYDAAGTPRGDEVRVDSLTTAMASGATVAAQPAGGFVVSWLSGRTGCCELRVRRFDGAGAPQGAETAVAPSVASEAAIAMDGAGGFVVVWTDRNSLEVRGQRFDALAVPRGAEFALPDAFGYPPAAASDPAGNFVVSWETGATYGQRFGGLLPQPAGVDAQPTSSSDGNGVLEPGEAADVAPR